MRIAAGLGATGLFLAIYFLAMRLRSSRRGEVAETVALGLLFFILGSIVLIVVGRGELLTLHPNDVLAPRYCFWSPFFWFALAVLALYQWPRLRLYPSLLGVLAILLAAGALPSQLGIGAAYAQGRKATEDAALRVICEVEDENSYQQLFRSELYSVSAVRPLARIYRERGLDMFAWPGASLFGQRVAPTVDPARPELGLLGHWRVDQILPTVRPGVSAARISGWCLQRKTHQTADYVLISQPGGRVVGYARFTVPNPEKNQKYRIPSRHRVGFEGYIWHYSSKRRYAGWAAVDGILCASPLRRQGMDAAMP